MGKVTPIKKRTDPVKLGRQLAIVKPDAQRPLERLYNTLSWQEKLRVRAEMARCKQAVRGKALAELV